MPRFYCPPPLPDTDMFLLPENAAHHAIRVLRLREGDSVQIFDGQGGECHGFIESISGKKVAIGRARHVDRDTESPLPVLLAQSLTSSEKMDWIIQKATELGATRIQPLDTGRSVARLDAERAQRRIEHWKQVAISACEQCGRNRMPEIYAPMDIMAWLEEMRAAACSKFILLPDGAASLHEQPRPETAALLIGPEGGFPDTEARAALLAGFVPIRLGARILRTETAAIAGLATLQTLWGDFCQQQS